MRARFFAFMTFSFSNRQFLRGALAFHPGCGQAASNNRNTIQTPSQTCATGVWWFNGVLAPNQTSQISVWNEFQGSNCIVRWKSVTSVTWLSINDLIGYKSATHQLHQLHRYQSTT